MAERRLTSHNVGILIKKFWPKTREAERLRQPHRRRRKAGSEGTVRFDVLTLFPKCFRVTDPEHSRNLPSIVAWCRFICGISDDVQLLRLLTSRINRAVKGCVAKQLEEKFPALLRASNSGLQQRFQSLGKTGDTCHVTLDVVDDRGRRSFLNASVEISSHTQVVVALCSLIE